MGKRKATIEYCQVRHVVHKYELQEFTMARTLSKAADRGYLNYQFLFIRHVG